MTVFEKDSEGNVIDPPVLPEFEERIQRASLTGRDSDVQRVQKEYEKARSAEVQRIESEAKKAEAKPNE